MTQAEILQHVASYGVQGGFWAAVCFPVVTAFYWPWWQHVWGWTIVSLDVAVALALFGEILVVEFGMTDTGVPAYVFAWVDAIALCAIPCIIAWRAVLTWKTQRKGNSK